MNRFSQQQKGIAWQIGHLGTAALVVIAVMTGMACRTDEPTPGAPAVEPQPDSALVQALAPVLVSDPVGGDSDDPAIWLHPDDPSQSLILGTDKAGAVYAFDLDGRIIPDKSVTGMGRINNIDVAYGVPLGGTANDIAVATDRNANLIRAFRLPDMTPIDNGGIEAFEGEPPELRRPMGLALYTRPADGALYPFFGWLSLALATVALIAGGGVFYRGALAGLRHVQVSARFDHGRRSFRVVRRWVPPR